MIATGPYSAIERLRRFKAGAASAEDRAWLSQAVRRYEASASEGITFDRALGLVPEPGQEAWWTVEARLARDEEIRRLRDRHFANLGITAASREIAVLARRYQSLAYPRQADTFSDRRQEFIARALETGRPFPGQRQIEEILRKGLAPGFRD